MSGSGTPSSVARILLVALIGSVFVLPASPAGANHIPGATYNGTVSNGGTVTFTISSDGSMVTTFKVENVPGDNCTFTSSTTSNIPISNHTFTRSVATGMSATGTFPNAGNAEGTVRINIPAIPCDSGTETWTATAPVPPTPTSFSFSTPKVKEGKVAKFTVTRSGDTSQPSSVPFATANGTAKAPKDYKAKSGTLEFAPGETTKEVGVKTKNDNKDEKKIEKFFMKFTIGTNVVQATGKIKDND